MVENTPIYNVAVISGSTTERSTTNNTSITQTIAATATGSFEGYVWYDSDNSGNTGNNLGNTEAPAAGITVEIYTSTGVKILTLTTNSAGMYS